MNADSSLEHQVPKEIVEKSCKALRAAWFELAPNKRGILIVEGQELIVWWFSEIVLVLGTLPIGEYTSTWQAYESGVQILEMNITFEVVLCGE